MFLSDFVLSHFYSLLIGTSATVRELTVYCFKPECFVTLPMPKLRNLTLCDCSAPFTNTMFTNKSLVTIKMGTWDVGTIDFRRLPNLRNLTVRDKVSEERFRNWNCNQLERVTVHIKVTIFVNKCSFYEEINFSPRVGVAFANGLGHRRLVPSSFL